VRGIARHDAKGQQAAHAADEFFQACGVAHTAIPEITAQRDGIAMKIEDEWSHHTTGRSAQAHAHSQRKAGDSVGSIQLTVK